MARTERRPWPLCFLKRGAPADSAAIPWYMAPNLKCIADVSMPAGLRCMLKPEFFHRNKRENTHGPRPAHAPQCATATLASFHDPENVSGVGLEDLAPLRMSARGSCVAVRPRRASCCFPHPFRRRVPARPTRCRRLPSPAVLRSLLTSRGERAFAEALGDLSGRVIADALSMLTASERARVSSRLSRAARHRLLDTAPDGEWPCTRLDSPSWSLLLAR